MTAGISGGRFLDVLADSGIRFLSGVPCSYFAAPLRLIGEHERLRYLPAVNEGAALTAAAGAQLSGAPSAVLAQNSGFGNLVNPLTSLVLPYRIPVLVVMSMRGWPSAGPGEPQHRLMGEVVPGWLASLGVWHQTLTVGGRPFADLLDAAGEALCAGDSAFILVGKGAIEADDDTPPAEARAGIRREDLVRALVDELGDELVLSSTGYLSRTLSTRDRPGNFYMQGSMGHLASLAIGAAIHRPDRRFVVLDGDGAALMHLGSWASVGHVSPPNLVHILFDNAGYESTGGQPPPATPDFAALAWACGYRHVLRADTTAQLPSALRAALASTGPVLLVVAGVAGGGAGERASEQLPVDAVAARFQAALSDPVTPR